MARKNPKKAIFEEPEEEETPVEEEPVEEEEAPRETSERQRALELEDEETRIIFAGPGEPLVDMDAYSYAVALERFNGIWMTMLGQTTSMEEVDFILEGPYHEDWLRMIANRWGFKRPLPPRVHEAIGHEDSNHEQHGWSSRERRRGQASSRWLLSWPGCLPRPQAVADFPSPTHHLLLLPYLPLNSLPLLPSFFLTLSLILFLFWGLEGLTPLLPPWLPLARLGQ